MKYCMLSLVAILVLGGCASKNQEALEEKILKPTSVEIYDIPVNSIWQETNSAKKALNNFPFVSNKPIVDFQGRFPDKFYDEIKNRYKSAMLKDVDFWKLRENIHAENFIYVLPMWTNQFQRVSSDLFEDIAYSNNLSSNDQEILKLWIHEGGVLWVEGGLYSTKYDAFNKDGEIDISTINKKMVAKTQGLSFMDHTVKTYTHESEKVDSINYEPIELSYKTNSSIDYFKDIKNLQVVTKNYLSVDFIPSGQNLIESSNGEPLVTFIKYGKGGVVFLRPFEFENKTFDGELLRWKLISYFMDKNIQKLNIQTMKNK